MKISTSDTVVVTTGKDKGKKGTVMRVLPDQHRVLVAGINMVTKHVKKTAQSEGRKFKTEHSIHVSNVSLLDPRSGKPTRVGYKIDQKTGKKIRIARKSGEPLTRVKLSKEQTTKAATEAATAPAPAKKSFWKRGGATSEPGSPSKAEAGPALSTPGHTRSAGRGS